MGWFIIGKLAEIAGDHDLVVSGLTLLLMNNPVIVFSLALPAVACGVILLISRRHRILISTVGTVSLVILLGVVIFTVVGVVGPLYGS